SSSSSTASSPSSPTSSPTSSASAPPASSAPASTTSLSNAPLASTTTTPSATSTSATCRPSATVASTGSSPTSQTCSVSFATEKDSDCDKYKTVADILNKDIDRIVDDERRTMLRRLKKDDGDVGGDDRSGPNSWCSCCGEPLKMRASKKFLRNLSTISLAPAPSPRMSTRNDELRAMETSSPRMSWLTNRNDDLRRIETPRSRYTELKFTSNVELDAPQNDADNQVAASKEDIRAAITPFLQDSKDQGEDLNRTPNFMRANKYFGEPFDPAQESPRWLNLSRSSKKLNFDKVDTLVEPLDISPLNEVDSDVLNRLKKQAHLDQDTLMAVYVELDKERSAAAVAANNAMAMITRIQQEKAAIQMEALQYQRMMEEQAEYDEEALELMRDMLIKKEDDVKALSSELDVYRVKYGTINKYGSDICEVDADDDFPEMKSQSSGFSGRLSDCNGLDGGEQRECEDPSQGHMEGESSLDFEGERSYLLGLLTDLEKKMISDRESSFAEMEAIKNDDQDKEGGQNKAVLTREVSMIKERLRVVEADSGFLKHAAKTIQIGEEGAKLLMEIAEHLRAIRQGANPLTPKVDA
ncbi:probable myosin-binding protein 5, partial [Salvia splendens]|uniref:probable myosin-binding protein 5 n=1 Tax=Salvia splendens TaxID=180675 RepID=UPI001C27248C